MKKNCKKIFNLIIFFVLWLMLFNVNTYATEIKKGDYSKEYLEWLKLSDEDKAKTIPPLPFNIRSNEKSTSLIDKIKKTVKSISIPSRYDLREHIEVEVKNQENTGECWAFTANSSIETYLALNNKIYNFSERHIDYDTAQNYIDGVNENALKRDVGSGGYGSTAFTYYSRGSGPILEEDMPFINDETPINLYELPKNSIVQKVDNMIYFPNIFKSWDENNKLVYTDGNGVEYSDSEIKEIRNKIKKHIMQYGAVSTAISAPNSNFNNYYCSSNVTDEDTWADHAVTIIGWDDSFSKNNFDQKPSTDGAYIVLNSWGTDWGKQGVYYISYEDLLVETNIRGITSVSDVEYDNLYQHDISEVWNIIKTKYAANVFKCDEDEKLTEVMVGCFSKEKCNIYVSNNTELNISNSTLIAENILLNPGYNTIKINETINLKKGNNFAIIVELINDNFEGIGIEDNNEVYFGNATSNLGESFMSSDGYTWSDIYDENNMMNFSIKAYTQTDEEKIEVTNVLGKAYEEFGGDYSFSIKTSYKEKDREVALKFYDENGNNLNNFIITGNKIRGNGTFVEFECPQGLEAGTYYVDVSLSNFDIVTKSFNVSEIDDDKVVLQFKDENFLRYIYIKTENSFVNYDSLQLIASQESIDNVTKLNDAYMKNIKDITGIQYYKNINEINFNSNEITDIEELKKLTNLNKLYLDGNKINDFSSISNLIGLEELRIGACGKLENIDFLNKLNNLTVLDMKLCGSKEKINIEKIFSLKGLELLDMSAWYWIDEKDLKDIYKLENLKFLGLNGCNIADLSFLESLNIETLQIGNAAYWMPDGTISEKGTNHFDDLTPLSEMTSLIELNINEVKELKNLNGLENLEKLECLWVEWGALRDAKVLDSELFKNKRWSNLWLYENRIEDVIEKTEENIVEIDVPVIISQACDSESLLYSLDGIILNNCEWKEYGKSIILDTSNYNSCSIDILSGYAKGTTYSVQVNKESGNSGTLSLVLPDKLTYQIGEDLDLSGARISYTEGDSAYWISLPNKDVTVTGYDKNKLGVQTITVTYKGKSTTFEVTVVEEDVPGNCKISISTEPRKTVYIKGEALDLEGGTIAVEEKDIGYRMEMTDSRLTIEGFDSNKIGEQIITISYKGQKVTFKVTVKNDVVSISISNLPKTTYIKGEKIDLTNGRILVTYEDGSTEERLMTDEDVEVNGFNNSILGKQTITLTYLNKTATFVINIICEHTYEEWNIIKKPTCEEIGLKERICGVCENKETETIEELGHVYSEEWTIDKEATCKEKGSKSHHCIREKCVGKVDVTEIPEIGHNYGEWIIDKDPTYEADGHKYRECLNCNFEKEEQLIPKLIKEELKVTTTYDIKEIESTKYITILPGVKVSEVLGSITANVEIIVIDKSGKKLESDDLVGTGAKVVTKEDKKEICIVVAKGDADGDAKVDFINDILGFNNHRIEIASLDVASVLAGDINQDGKIDFLNDILIINNYRIGIINSL